MWTALLALIAQKMLFVALHLESGSFPRPLSLREERECFAQLASPDQKEAAAARDRLIRHNLRLVSHIAKKYYAGGVQEQDDLVSIGTIGLIKAVDLALGEDNELPDLSGDTVSGKIELAPLECVFLVI